MGILQQLQQGVLLLDGGMGTLLQARGLSAGELPERWNVTRAEEIVSIHRAYLQAGANAITTNTFGANGLKYSKEELQSVVSAALDCAERAVKQEGNGYIIFDIGPCGKLLKPYGDLPFEEAVELFSEVVRLVGNRADAILVETMNDSYETKAAVLAVKENSSLPLFVSNVYGEDGKLMTGADIPAMVALLEGLGVDAIGVNCSLGSAQMRDLVSKFYEYSSLPVFVQPNAGLPREENGVTVYGENEQTFCENILSCVRFGARMVGGCCGTTPDYIRAVSKAIDGVQPLPILPREHTLVSSFARAVEIGKRPVLIGERINPTGKKRLKQALLEGEIDYVLGEAVAQAEQGAHALDVNVGVPGLDEPKVLSEVAQAVQTVTELPLQLDSSSPEALERAMRLYNGKPMVNSVNGKRESMEAVFPLVKKYGGVVVALTLDENGIPTTAEGRFEIAKRILARASKYGIEKKNIVFDTLAMAVSADTGAPNATLKAISLIKNQLNAHTVLGVSNVSFGLPNREVITAAFFTLALSSGLSAAIVNPFSVELKKAYQSYLALTAQDENCAEYINFAQTLTPSTASAPVAQKQEEDEGLKQAILSGRGEKAKACAERLLKEKSPVEIIDGEIVPALDEVGKRFEEKTLFLPQLLMSAEAAKQAFFSVKSYLASQGEAQRSKATVLLATVRGDIHDIGKNIVKALLENYSFRVVDMGKDVPPEQIVERVVAEKIPLVGLSALMTTTVPAMEQTISLLRKQAPWCKIIVGGAVLTEDYAQKLGADGYGKDAMATVRYCEGAVKGESK